MTDTSTPASLVMQIGGAMALVILLIFACAWLARRSGLASRLRADGNIIAVKASYSLGQRERLVVVEIDGERLLLGVTPGAITRLGRLSAPTPAPHEAGETPNFQQTLKRLLKRDKVEPEE
ncbi:flagellar biosynthetic protein FliO [Mixta tenebrionis]|uniref:Flagellar protein n=1 Tax=Mixta tenebrionis TaxID=2562439 RepID=A0A506V448_9GAMM|nr:MULTISPECIES: flagellar biosynthetic protein FliO [Mixta]QHM77469.1 Flagellar protein FliO [Mixta theicola]TPW40641.1 flagellar biosynthetic protein FliO [Mixta tenebrionis]